jgi:hypothetical protein
MINTDTQCPFSKIKLLSNINFLEKSWVEKTQFYCLLFFPITVVFFSIIFAGCSLQNPDPKPCFLPLPSFLQQTIFTSVGLSETFSHSVNRFFSFL